MDVRILETPLPPCPQIYYPPPPLSADVFYEQPLTSYGSTCTQCRRFDGMGGGKRVVPLPNDYLCPHFGLLKMLFCSIMLRQGNRQQWKKE